MDDKFALEYFKLRVAREEATLTSPTCLHVTPSPTPPTATRLSAPQGATPFTPSILQAASPTSKSSQDNNNQDWMSYWQSPEAFYLFAPNAGERADQDLEHRIELLDGAINEISGYKQIIPPPGDPDNLYSMNEQKVVQHRAMLLRCAYDFSLKLTGDGVSFQQCCEKACAAVQLMGITIGNDQSNMKWNREFRDNNFFRHLNQIVTTGMKPEPHLFELFPEAKGHLLSYASTHLSKLSIEKVKNYLTAAS